MKRSFHPGAAFATLALLVVGGGCGADDFGPRVDFAADQDVFDLQLDTGDVVIGTGASGRITTKAVAGYTIEAAGQTRNGSFEPIDDSGAMLLSASFALDIYADIDLPVGQFNGLVKSVDVAFEADVGSFDPFLIDQPVTLIGGFPAEREIRAPVLGLPGTQIVVELAGVGFIPTFEGVCVAQDGDAVQYTGLVKLEPDLRYLYSIEISIPFGPTEVIGPVGLEADFGAAFVHELDLGTFSVDSGTPIEGVFPCGEVDASPPAVTGAALTAGGDESGSGESGGDGTGTTG